MKGRYWVAVAAGDTGGESIIRDGHELEKWRLVKICGSLGLPNHDPSLMFPFNELVMHDVAQLAKAIYSLPAACLPT